MKETKMKLKILRIGLSVTVVASTLVFPSSKAEACLSLNSTLTSLQQGESNLTSAVIDTSNGQHYAYFGTDTSPGQVVKVDLSNLTRVGAISLKSGEDRLASAVIDTSNSTHYAYFGTYSGQVVKIDLNSFTEVDR